MKHAPPAPLLPAFLPAYLPALLLALPLALAACREEDGAGRIPPPVELTEEAAGHYCQMIILEHEGPKAQVHVAGYPDPFWFSQVRDGLAFLKSPEQLGEVLVVYVNDMGAAQSWADPGAGNWIRAREAFFVVGSDVRGGMGAPETVPFATRAGAEAFAAEHGGEVMRLDDIPIEAVLAPIDLTSTETDTADPGRSASDQPAPDQPAPNQPETQE